MERAVLGMGDQKVKTYISTFRGPAVLVARTYTAALQGIRMPTHLSTVVGSISKSHRDGLSHCAGDRCCSCCSLGTGLAST